MKSDEVISAVQEAFSSDRIETTRHFWDELRADGLVLADVICAMESIHRVADMGLDEAGHEKFEVTGLSVDDRMLSVICAIKEETETVLLITAYEGD